MPPDSGAASRRQGGQIAAGILLALANATKYATAIYDPTVVCVAILSSWQDAGWRAALRRAAFLAGVAVAVLAVLLVLGGSGYLDRYPLDHDRARPRNR